MNSHTLVRSTQKMFAGVAITMLAVACLGATQSASSAAGHGSSHVNVAAKEYKAATAKEY
jgi:hypothetical protein